MSEITRERLFGFRHAFDDRVTVVLTLIALISVPVSASAHSYRNPGSQQLQR